jgi:membrane protein YdbS with pleckstrin-like domain
MHSLNESAKPDAPSSENTVDALALMPMQPLHPNARWGMHAGAALLALAPLLPGSLIARANDLPWSAVLPSAAAVGLLLQLLAFLYARARYRHARFALDEQGLLLQRGVFWRSETRVPRSRVQHTDINRGPLDRWLGLAELKVHTAGTRLAAVSVSGLSEAQARELRNSLIGEDDDEV